ncbi:MAG: glycoside hydrolase family 95 protein [Dysgonamonadaceae bacterium]|nr:glycoside hydrolase family 95 protein [Dysgonamonadaceae bacterium]
MKKIIFPAFILFLGLISICSHAQTHDQLKLVYDSPAKIWEATLPLGNGRLGMMPDGGVESEKIVLNDITMWSGSVEDALNPEAANYLPIIRQLLKEGKNHDAQKIMYQHFKCKGEGSAHGSGKDAPYGSFQLLGNLLINYHYPSKESVSNYQRELSISDAVARTSFRKGNVDFMREYFVSHEHGVIVIRLQADRKESIAFDVSLSRPERYEVSIKNNKLIMEGQLNDGLNGENGVKYFTKLEIVHKGGKIESNEKSLSLTNADEAFIIVSSSTNMLDADYENTVHNLLTEARIKSFAELKEKHVEKYRDKFNRVELDLGKQDNETPTNLRLSEFQQNDDASFVALYFQFGRYLMISGSRENTLPLNLQGLWANSVQSPWNGDYHLNINVQMNYWPAEVCNLSELHKPLVRFTEKLVPSGTATATTYYDAEGWMAHMMSNPWQFTAPGEHASWGSTITGGAWLCQHVWEHFSFMQDTTYLKRVYPLLKGAADFFLSSMIEEPKNGWLVTAPSSSPENAFFLPDNDQPVYVCMGPTMDVQIVNELFSNLLKASEILQIENETTAQIKEALPKLPPMQISPEGYLQEWMEDYKEYEPQHRHVSHLYGLYPSNQISVHETPDLADAAKQTLERRGDGGTGWSRAWKINFWARLHNGNRAYKLLKSLLEPAINELDTTSSHGAGTYPNLFCAHPPFQIDGNLGGTAGIAEMLIQSQHDYIELLPALPDNWSEGSFKGLRVRGGAEVNAKWHNKKLEEIKVISDFDRTYKLKIPTYISSVNSPQMRVEIKDGMVLLAMKKGETVTLTMNE